MNTDHNIEITQTSYLKYKKDFLDLLAEINNNIVAQKIAEDIFNEEKIFLNSSDTMRLKIAIYKLHYAGFLLLKGNFDYVADIFYKIIKNKALTVDQNQANDLINTGNNCIKTKDTAKLIMIIRKLYELLSKDNNKLENFYLPIGIL